MTFLLCPVSKNKKQKYITELKNQWNEIIKVGLSPSKKNCVVSFIESPLKIMKNVFYLILKVDFVFKIFKFLSWLFGHVEKMPWLER